MESRLINLALEISAKAHSKQKRKGTDIPYIIHPVGVALILSKYGYSDDFIIAGLLHDTVEDTSVTLKDIEKLFGKEIADIVDGCTEPNKFWSWKKRKMHTIELLKTASEGIRTVSCADKLHNIGTMKNEFENIGEKVWKRFKVGREEYRWYFQSIVEVICNNENQKPLFNEFKNEVENFFGK